MMKADWIKNPSFKYGLKSLLHICFDCVYVSSTHSVNPCFKYICRLYIVFIPSFTPIGGTEYTIQVRLLNTIELCRIVGRIAVES